MINTRVMETLETLFGEKFSNEDFKAMDCLIHDPGSNDILTKVIAKDFIKRYNNAIDWCCAKNMVDEIRGVDKIIILFEIMDKDETISESLFEIIKLKRESRAINNNLSEALKALSEEEE